jgi:hypothetical protein
VVGAVHAGIMPPWPASDDCRELRDSAALPEATRALFVEWASQEFPEGDPDAYRRPGRTAGDDSEPTLLLGPGEAYVPAENADEYRCFVLPGTVEQDLYITGMDILPGERSQVHHVQIHRVSAAQAETVQSLDARNDGLGYPCTAGTGVFSQNLFSYRPGSSRVSFAPGDAVFIEAGSSFVIQVHYNTQFLPRDETPKPDETRVAFWTLPDGELPERVVYRSGTIAPLVIPAGDPAYVAESAIAMQAISGVGGMFGIGGTYVPGEIIGMTPHAHQLASRMTATLRRASGDECLIDIPQWNFHWQLDYMHAQPLAYEATDQLVARCEYDNSPANQAVVDGVRLAPREVTWGEGSLDEMCLHYVWLRFERDAFLEARAATATR